MKSLVVDDSLTMRRIIINALQRIGYADTVEGSDGHLHSHDITAQQLDHIASVLADMRLRIVQIIAIFNPTAIVATPAQAAALAFDPHASSLRSPAGDRQAVADEIFDVGG